MTNAIGVAVLLALVAGGVTGFGKRWQESLIFSALVVPLVAAAVTAMAVSFGWGVLTLVWSFLAASIAWGVAACIRHVVSRFLHAS